MSDPFERLAGEVRRHPLLTLAVAGALGAVVVSRLAATDDVAREAVGGDGRSDAKGLGERVSGLAEKSASLARRGADAVDRGASVAERGAAFIGRRGRRLGRDVKEIAEDTGEEIAETGASSRERANDAFDADSIVELLRELLPDRVAGREPRNGIDRVRDAAASIGITEKTVAAFAATLLAKSASGYFRWRGEERARHRAEALTHAAGRDFEARLEDHTVAELRRMAADREIEGRSAMNKDELVEALAGD